MCELFLPNRLHHSHMELLLVKLGVGKKSPICPFRSSLSNRVNICFSRFRIANRLLAEDYSTSTDYSQASIVTPLLSSRIRIG